MTCRCFFSRTNKRRYVQNHFSSWFLFEKHHLSNLFYWCFENVKPNCTYVVNIWVVNLMAHVNWIAIQYASMNGSWKHSSVFFSTIVSFHFIIRNILLSFCFEFGCCKRKVHLIITFQSFLSFYQYHHWTQCQMEIEYTSKNKHIFSRLCYIHIWYTSISRQSKKQNDKAIEYSILCAFLKFFSSPIVYAFNLLMCLCHILNVPSGCVYFFLANSRMVCTTVFNIENDRKWYSFCISYKNPITIRYYQQTAISIFLVHLSITSIYSIYNKGMYICVLIVYDVLLSTSQCSGASRQLYYSLAVSYVKVPIVCETKMCVGVCIYLYAWREIHSLVFEEMAWNTFAGKSVRWHGSKGEWGRQNHVSLLLLYHLVRDETVWCHFNIRCHSYILAMIINPSVWVYLKCAAA